MKFPDHAIAELRDVAVLTDEGLDLSVLDEEKNFGEDQHSITVGGEAK